MTGPTGPPSPVLLIAALEDLEDYFFFYLTFHRLDVTSEEKPLSFTPVFTRTANEAAGRDRQRLFGSAQGHGDVSLILEI